MGRQYGKSAAINAVTLAPLLLISGRPGWLGAWLFVAMMFCVQLSVILLVFRKDPDLMRERERRFKGTRPGDKWPTAAGVLLAPIAMYVVAALEARFAWQPSAPPWLVPAGFVLCAAGASSPPPCASRPTAATNWWIPAPMPWCAIPAISAC